MVVCLIHSGVFYFEVNQKAGYSVVRGLFYFMTLAFYALLMLEMPRKDCGSGEGHFRGSAS